jgi:hypothetical protein
MALTLREKANLRKGKALNDATVTLIDAIDEGIRQLSAEILRGNVTIADPLISPSACTAMQLSNISERGVRGAMYNSMISSLTGDAAFENAGVNVTDGQITNAVKRQVGYFAKWVGLIL